eukprot:CAMPEP_0178568468 /NCGR_PEP_ID=MMETSP0697-20121206/15926_1 /TAXON_ID=265572 /ORGANISM="Extubocellulus spinifer, Strain CCMP396" /LENGTH=627 /DNA_ID=CAMNT_0020202573 /DNA_START=65 /DNA_END=1949 /DNA_ORIENTATION=-
MSTRMMKRTLLVAVLLAMHLISCSASTMWGGQCYDSTSSVSSCMNCCQKRKCKSRCLDRCKDKAKSIANDKEDWCDSFDGYYGSSSYYGFWDEDELHEHPREDCNSENKCDRCEGDCDRDAHCKGDLKCFERDGKEPVPGCYGSGKTDFDYCYDPDYENGSDFGRCGEDLGYSKPRKCLDFEECVLEYYLDEFAEGTADKAWDYCDKLPISTPYYNKAATLDPLVSSPVPVKYSSGYADGECDHLLKDLGMKSSGKICDDFWYCVEQWEKDNYLSTSYQWARAKADAAYDDCDNCSGKCSDVKDKYASGKCDGDLGGWKRTCDDYKSCWLDYLRDECEDCSKDSNRNKDKCEDPIDKCYDNCIDDNDFKSSCIPECDKCYCTYASYLDEAQDAANKCLDFVDLCCDRPYDWLNDPNMRSVEMLDRSCTPANPCGTCRGDCANDSDCTNWQRGANKCALPAAGGGWSVPSISASPVDYIPGCKGIPIPGVGYCFNPNKTYADRNDVTDQCLAKKATSDYGQCCDLPRSYTQCGDFEFSPDGMRYYCSQFNRAVDPPTDPPANPPTDETVDSGTPPLDGTTSASCISMGSLNAKQPHFAARAMKRYAARVLRLSIQQPLLVVHPMAVQI